MSKKLFAVSTFASFFLLAGFSFAQSSSCQPIYGGGKTCLTEGNLMVDKKVQRPGGTSYVDNLSEVESYYSPTVNFQLTIKNTSNKRIENVTVTDRLPNGFTFVSGPGSFDKGSNTLTFALKLEKAETRTVTIATRVEKSDSRLQCFVNYAQAKRDNKVADDNSRFCVGQLGVSPTPPAQNKGGLPVQKAPDLKQTPGTGAGALGILLLVPAALGGLMLRRRAK